MPFRHTSRPRHRRARAGARRGGRGFSLVELLVALAVVGILVAIALPRYVKYRKHMRIGQAIEDVGTMSAAITSYWADHRSYPDSLADVGLDTKLDPWGHPYAYYNVAAHGHGGARKDAASRALNEDYDLYSLGPNGKSTQEVTSWNSADDIIRAAGGAYVGLAAGL